MSSTIRNVRNIIKYIEPYSNDLKEKLEKNLYINLGHTGEFTDDIWIYKNHINYKKSSELKFAIRFSSVPLQYKSIVKYYILRDLRAVGTNNIRIRGIYRFLNFMISYYDIKNLNDIHYNMLEHYRSDLEQLDNTAGVVKGFWSDVEGFFSTMKDFDEVPDLQFPSAPNFQVLKRKENELKELEETFIPKAVFIELDKVFLDFKEFIPIHVQSIYWTLRLIPTRINEVLDMWISTAVREFNDEIKITIPVPKPSNNLDIVEKIITLTGKSAAEKFLIELLEKQKEVSSSLQERVKEKNLTEGLLYTCLKIDANNPDYLKKLKYSKMLIARFSDKNFNRWLEYIINTANNFKDEKGYRKYKLYDDNDNLYHITSHDFRHEGITDRFDYGFVTHKVMFVAGLVTENTAFGYYNSKPDNPILTEPIYKEDINNSDEFFIKAVDIIDNDIVGNEVSSNLSFQGNSNIDDILLNFQVEIDGYSPIVTNEGYYLGNCPNIYDCGKIKREMNCIGCEYSVQQINVNNEFVEKALMKYESDICFYRASGNIRMAKIAKIYFDKFKKHKEKLLKGETDGYN